MKKIILIGILILLFMVFLTACTQTEEAKEEEEKPGKPEVENDVADYDEIVDLAEEFLNHLSSGEFEEARENFDQIMLDSLSEADLESLWVGLEDEFGSYFGHEFDSTAEADGYDLVYIRGNFNDRDVTFQIAFNENNEISGFYVI